tara:strand:- start:458 stop:619 length:162 start_codon:yes stop_codon:yes gene_type:complete
VPRNIQSEKRRKGQFFEQNLCWKRYQKDTMMMAFIKIIITRLKPLHANVANAI